MIKFKHAAFIELNTPGIREKLEELGYEQNIGLRKDGKYIRTFGLGATYGQFDKEFVKAGAYDCGTSIPLFLAIAAIREDSDINQYFVAEVDCHFVDSETCAPKGSLILCTTDDYHCGISPELDSMRVPAHKATPEEIIEHFKNKEQ